MDTVNHNLQEVLCGFRFKDEEWDSTFFGKYFELMKSLGYDEKQEQKGYEVKLEIKPESRPEPQYKESEPRMVFNNKKEKSAILLAKNYISFHKLSPYKNWECFLNEQIIPGIKKYFALGLGNSLASVQMLYLNKFTIDSNESLSTKFNFIPSTEEFGIGKEKNLVFQSQYELEPSLLMQLKISTLQIEKHAKKDVFLECSCTAFNSGADSWDDLAQLAHDKNNVVFNKITKQHV